MLASLFLNLPKTSMHFFDITKKHEQQKVKKKESVSWDTELTKNNKDLVLLE